ncbi:MULTISPECIES: glutamate synthase-related protein [Methanobrevibacter]|uniref:Archaeal glutamate synthase [NADPH] n=1 Tax=Methanobrevibacter gottschalkii DSM 11977 TaxID=1122229 RepID=A0A3N5B0A8_9EURY|nr:MULTISPECIES: glutamate synthase-related protein [Methanobrevibacter]OED01718.1 glutamate synthase [Methanobrevibacter sp. A27]RPF50996.1 glutamate synthase-like protein [Methanobrevibacter gottschalkii DSM 11977]
MIYKCLICGHIHNEEATGVLLKDLDKCPTCKQDISNFVEFENSDSDYKIQNEPTDLSYPKEFAKSDKDIRHMDTIHQIAISGESIISSMYTELPMPNWDDILILGCQLNPQPIESNIDVNTTTVIGKNAKIPLVIESPIYITHMSFGALSRESKIALAKGSASVKTAQCSGEGGILPEEMENAYKYIFEYVPNKYSVNDENLKNSDAIEIKIGQSTKPGLGGQLQGVKVTPEIAKIRNKPVGQDIHSPATIPEVNSKHDLKELVSYLRKKSRGRPIGLKFAAGRIEEDLEYACYAEPDFITIDGRGGSTGASPKIIRDSTSVPTIYALSRARKYLDEHDKDISLIITGGLRVSSDFAKALAMGADAIAIGTGALIASACQQYKICQTGHCPVGVATQDMENRERFKIESAAKRVENYLKVSNEELKQFSRITGHDNVHDLNMNDLCTINSEISNYTNIKHT